MKLRSAYDEMVSHDGMNEEGRRAKAAAAV
jgi:hypothetical protein